MPIACHAMSPRLAGWWWCAQQRYHAQCRQHLALHLAVLAIGIRAKPGMQCIFKAQHGAGLRLRAVHDDDRHNGVLLDHLVTCQQPSVGLQASNIAVVCLNICYPHVRRSLGAVRAKAGQGGTVRDGYRRQGILLYRNQTNEGRLITLNTAVLV